MFRDAVVDHSVRRLRECVHLHPARDQVHGLRRPELRRAERSPRDQRPLEVLQRVVVVQRELRQHLHVVWHVCPVGCETLRLLEDRVGPPERGLVRVGLQFRDGCSQHSDGLSRHQHLVAARMEVAHGMRGWDTGVTSGSRNLQANVQGAFLSGVGDGKNDVATVERAKVTWIDNSQFIV